ncbi:MAG: hypothetical protein R6V75_07720 [Bacteroidales bacterium]
MSTTKIILSLILIGTVSTAEGWSQKTQSIKTELTYSLWLIAPANMPLEL